MSAIPLGEFKDGELQPDYLMPHVDKAIATIPGSGRCSMVELEQTGRAMQLKVTFPLEGWIDEKGRLVVRPELPDFAQGLDGPCPACGDEARACGCAHGEP